MDVLPPFRPASLIFLDKEGMPPGLGDTRALQRCVDELASMMEENAVLMGRDSAEAGGSSGDDEEQGADDGGDDGGGGGAGGDVGREGKRGRGRSGSASGLKEHFRVKKTPK